MTAETRQWIVGILVNLNLVFFYGAPLSTIATVLQTKNSASIHLWTMMTNTGNGAFWTAYGLAVDDSFVSVPNGLGTLLGVIQMIFCMTFPRTQIASEDATHVSNNYNYNTPGGGEKTDKGSGFAEATYRLPLQTFTLGQLQMIEQTRDLDSAVDPATITGSNTSPELLRSGDAEVEVEHVRQQQEQHDI